MTKVKFLQALQCSHGSYAHGEVVSVVGGSPLHAELQRLIGAGVCQIVKDEGTKETAVVKPARETANADKKTRT